MQHRNSLHLLLTLSGEVFFDNRFISFTVLCLHVSPCASPHAIPVNSQMLKKTTQPLPCKFDGTRTTGMLCLCYAEATTTILRDYTTMW